MNRFGMTDERNDELTYAVNDKLTNALSFLGRGSSGPMINDSGRIAPLGIGERPPLRSLVRSLAHFAHSLARGTVNDYK